MKRSLQYILKFSAKTAAVCAVAALLASCHSRTRIVRVDDNRDSKHPTEEIYKIDVSTVRGRIIEEANTWIGTPYKWGGEEKGVCADCSGMVMKVYQESAEIMLPRTSFDQSQFCTPLQKKDIKQADLVFFATGSDSTRVSHVGIMIDDDRFIHASSTSGVKISHVSSPYFTRRLISYGRVPGLK